MIELDIMVRERAIGSSLDDAEALAQRAAEAAAAVAMARDGEALEVSVMLTDDAQIRELNRTSGERTSHQRAVVSGARLPEQAAG